MGGQGQALYKPAVLWRGAFIIKDRSIKVIGLAHGQQPYLCLGMSQSAIFGM